jgi:hypothetical protein
MVEGQNGHEPAAPVASSLVRQSRVVSRPESRSRLRAPAALSDAEQSDRALVAWVASHDLGSQRSIESSYARPDFADLADEPEAEPASALDRVFETLGAASSM